jgi:DNA (cytosine-5)-methyltransferase 1
MIKKKRLIGIDLFAGAGGLSLGARLAGIDVVLAIENEPNAAATYAYNHPKTRLIVEDVRKIKRIDIKRGNKKVILFGGAPCQGFSTSNQRTRNKENEGNWLFKEFIRLAKIIKPEWIVFENVKGIVETANGEFKDRILADFKALGYLCTDGTLCAKDFGVPQARTRYFIIASKNGVAVTMPKPLVNKHITVKQAFCDLPKLTSGANIDILSYRHEAITKYAKQMRGKRKMCANNLVTKNAKEIIKRYEHIPQGGNWENIPKRLMKNYKNYNNCHTGIYKRLDENKPSVVVGNYRKNMLIHPNEARGLSVREAARLQSFPDWYIFKGSIGFQQQQVGNAVPPLLSAALFKTIVVHEDIY